MIDRFVFIICFLCVVCGYCQGSSGEFAALKSGDRVGGLRVANLYADATRQIIGAKFRDTRSGAPIYLFQIETVPQVFMWVDTPPYSNAGLAHSLEHLLAGKGTKGRYASLLKEMRVSRSAAATTDDFNLYSFSSGTGLGGFFEQFHAWLDALYKPDFTDLEAEREFYHFGISIDPATKTRTLVEQGSVYDEMQADQGAYTYYFELNKRVFGSSNPFGFYGGGVPAEMRRVTPADIRRFYAEHYRLGPTTGFIFALPPRESARNFLERISGELAQFTSSDVLKEVSHTSAMPKYPIDPATNEGITIFPFPSGSGSDRGEVRFGWKPIQAYSQTDVKLLQLFFRALGDGDKSLLYKSLIDRKARDFDSGATNVESLVFLGNSPFFPAEFVGFSGISGNQITEENIQRLRNRISTTIGEISRYPDHSQDLARFDRLVASYMTSWRRSQAVWLKSAPQFGLGYDTAWKEYLEYSEMDTSFIRSISDDAVWAAVEERIRSGENIWRNLIHEFHLLDVPYATGSAPSPELMRQTQDATQRRIAEKLKQLMYRFHTNNEQEALTKFEQEESARTREIDKIAAQVPRRKFTDHPPLTPDDDIRYSQYRLHNVPVIAAFFDRTPTLDLGLSFDLHKIPQKYYKYLPILPRCLDSLGLKQGHKTVSYADLQTQTQTEMNDFSVGYDFSSVSHRADLRIQASTLTPAEFRRALLLIQRMTTFNYLDVSNVDRLRDLVDKRRWEDDAFDKGGNDYWFMNPSRAFRYQGDALYVALSSAFTRSHWDDRLKWLLHKEVNPREIADLSNFAEKTLSSASGLSARQVAQKLSTTEATGLEQELLEYWERNIRVFPERELLAGLRKLTSEVQEDLTQGPERTIADLRDLQTIVINRRAVTVDLTVDHATLAQIQPALANFLDSIPDRPYPENASSDTAKKNPFTANLRRRYNLETTDFPWYIGFEDSHGTTANLIFYADFPGYTQLDRESLLKLLSSNLAAGSGPHTFYMKTQEDGLAYGSSVHSDPKLRLLQYYAARNPDITSLIQLVNSIAETIPGLRDPSLLDYALQETFPIPRSMSTFTERGRGLAKDIRDGNNPAKVRRFSQAILKLRNDPNLFPELTSLAMDSICPVLIKSDCVQEQRNARSLFFFTAPEKLLADAERKLGIPILRLYPADFWINYENESNQRASRPTKTTPGPVEFALSSN